MALTPPDHKRCQAEIREGSFMTFGPRSMRRCDNPTVFIAKEKQPGADGETGSMGLCEDCMKVLIKQHGKNFATLTRVNADFPKV